MNMTRTKKLNAKGQQYVPCVTIVNGHQLRSDEPFDAVEFAKALQRRKAARRSITKADLIRKVENDLRRRGIQV